MAGYVASDYDFYVEIEGMNGPLSRTPIRSCNLGSLAHPFYLVREMRIPKPPRLTIKIHNTLSTSRKWNRIAIVFYGEKQFGEIPAAMVGS